jgi:hypothetical protein
MRKTKPVRFSDPRRVDRLQIQCSLLRDPSYFHRFHLIVVLEDPVLRRQGIAVGYFLVRLVREWRIIDPNALLRRNTRLE